MLSAQWFMNVFASRIARRAALVAGITLSTIVLQAQSKVTDAEVQSAVLKALASSPELANETIGIKTMAGNVTLTGSVRDEAARRKAENLAANTVGVLKVLDELTLTPGFEEKSSVSDGAPSMLLLSDGSYAPSGEPPLTPVQQTLDPPPSQTPASEQLPNQHAVVNQATQQGSVAPSDKAAPSGAYTGAPQYGRRPMGQTHPSPQDRSYPPPPPQGSYPNQHPVQNYPGRNPQSPSQPDPRNPELLYAGQAAGHPVLIPAGVLIRVRLNRALASNKTPSGSLFDGVIVNDVSAGDFIAIPRGASVQGTVVQSKSSGTLKGRGELSIQVTQVTLAGHVYPIVTDVWAHNGGDKTIETVNKTAGFGAAGLILGAIVGGAPGAAIGGGIGAATGIGSAAASDRGQVSIPSEGIVTFHLAKDAQLQTVSEQEMQRLAYGVPPGADQRTLRTRNTPRVYGAPRYPPYYYPGPYGPYGYPPY